MQIQPLDASDPVAMSAWHAAHHVAHVQGLEHPTAWLLEEMRASFLGTSTGERIEPFAGYVERRCVVVGVVEMPMKDNLSIAHIDVATPPAERRRGYASAMLEHLTEVALAHDRSVLATVAAWRYDAPADGAGTVNADFLTAQGFTFSLGDVKRMLELPVDAARLEDLRGHAAPYHLGYAIRAWTGPVPDDLIEGFGDLVGTLFTEAPMGELQLEREVFDAERIRADEAVLAASGRTKYTTVAIAADGELVAYSEIAAPGHHPDHAFQWGTLVRPEHRGHRLGLATKVLNLQRFQAAEPARTELFTYNAEVNRHMIAVNDALGFRPVGRLGEFQKKL